MIVRGVFHCHTRVSKDAGLTHEDIAAFARERGFGFVLFGEHRDRMTEDEVREASARCDALTTVDLLMIPGQEQEVPAPRKFHIVGIGVREPIVATEPVPVVDEIRAAGGISVLAHPTRYRTHPAPEGLLDAVDGIEVFNLRYDGRHGAREEVRALLDPRPDTLVLAGLDAHDPDDLGRDEAPVMALEVESLTEAAVLDAVRAGRFTIEIAGETVDLRGRASSIRRAGAGLRRGVFGTARAAKRGLARVGIRLPESWVRAVRRRF